MLTFWDVDRFSQFMEFSPNAFRAARALLGLNQDDVAEKAGVDRKVVGRLEKSRYARPTEPMHRVKRFYENAGLLFLANGSGEFDGIRWEKVGHEDFFRRRQLHAARVLLDLSQTDLAKESGVERSVLSRIESGETSSPLPKYLDQLSAALEASGAEFLSDGPSGGFGVRLYPKEN